MKRIIAPQLSLVLMLTTMGMPAMAESTDADIIIVGAGCAGDHVMYTHALEELG